METRFPTEIAEEWIQKWSAPETPAIGPGMESVLDWELPREQPALCLSAILEVLSRIDGSKPNQLLSVLAAGPLEDLLNYNGDAVVDEIDSLARKSPEFRLLLNGVWNSDIKPSILARLAKYRGNPW
nr:hypothetical protein [uncultured Methylotenera sp.]